MRKRLHARVTRIKLIPNITDYHKKYLEIPQEHKSMGILACDMENVMYPALDHASKEANIKVVYSSSAYMGRSNLWAQVRGQVIGIITGANVADVKKGLDYIRVFIEKEAELYAFDEEERMLCYAHLMPRCGKHYRESYGIPRGMAAVHLATSPLENTYALDKALKAGNTRVAKLFDLPTKSNIGGAILYGSQEACRASLDAYMNAVEYCCNHSMDLD